MKEAQSSAFGSASPAIVRRAGLPAEAMAPFGSPACAAAAAGLADLERRLGELRGELVAALHAAVHDAPPESRKLLLAAKRDAYNGRPLGRLRGAAGWPLVERAAPALVAEAARLEDELTRAGEEFTALFERERAREAASLAASLDDRDFCRGLTLASPDLVDTLQRHRAGVRLSSGRIERAEANLLRYLSRTSLKLSPFSTLTQVGLGLVDAPREGAAQPIALLPLKDGGPRELRRYYWFYLRNFFTLLKLHEPFRRRLAIRRNDTLEPLEPGRWRLVRPFDWELSADRKEICHYPEAVIKIALEGPVAAALLGSRGAWDHFADLVRQLAAEARVSEEEAALPLGRLFKAGVLLFDPPWSSTDEDPERKLREFLEAAPDLDPLSLELAGRLRQLENLMAETPTGQTLPAMRHRLGELIESSFAALRGGLGLSDLAVKLRNSFHEDVYLEGAESAARYGEIARIARPAALRALLSIRPLVLFSDLHYTRYEFLLSLRSLIARRWPGRRRVPLLAVMNESQILWRDHVESSTANMRESTGRAHNPFDLEEIRELQRLRRAVTDQLTACLRPDGEDYAYDLAAAERAVELIPAHFRPTYGPCLFMQPAGAGEDLWVLNHLLDGTGRFSTRYTKVMPPDQRARYLEHFRRRAYFPHWKGGEAEIVDLFCSRGDQLNLHAVQTPRVLELPGENLGLPPERRLPVAELAVDMDGVLPTLVDAEDRQVMPTFLGATSLFPMPTLVKFLAHFSLAEFRLIYPQRASATRDGVELQGRVRIGNMVVHRRTWVFSPAAAFPGFGALSDRALYLAVQRWQKAHRIPERVFAAEKLRSEFKLWDLHKPQYLDLSSPAFLPILRACCEASPERLELREALPEAAAFPRGEDGRHWALEVQLEAAAMAPEPSRRGADEKIPVVDCQLQMV